MPKIRREAAQLLVKKNGRQEELLVILVLIKVQLSDGLLNLKYMDITIYQLNLLNRIITQNN